ncbi:MAG: HEAT repeat domain-containing protein [Sandaracinus sp.]|nr:HEAT repeat domain-containing protein [Sandaracinus sp.]MCB9622148.1 HEAT repeat domain-containing protein [Sandaracinus sp.]MCB9630560.1 HEAT repeat domain-containing protein [Sandaracinus sp.]
MRFAFVLSLLLFASPLVAQRGAPSRDQVRAMLSGVDTAPSDEAWRRLGPDTLAVLVALYDDQSTPFFVRMRAVSAAAHYPTPATRTFLEAVARAPGQRDLIVRRAVVALGRAFGADALDSVRPYLAHPEASVREGAVKTILAMGTPAAQAALRQRAAVETDPTVRAALGL